MGFLRVFTRAIKNYWGTGTGKPETRFWLGNIKNRVPRFRYLFLVHSFYREYRNRVRIYIIIYIF
jgi:hypothetical protein